MLNAAVCSFCACCEGVNGTANRNLNLAALTELFISKHTSSKTPLTVSFDVVVKNRFSQLKSINVKPLLTNFVHSFFSLNRLNKIYFSTSIKLGTKLTKDVSSPHKLNILKKI